LYWFSSCYRASLLCDIKVLGFKPVGNVVSFVCIDSDKESNQKTSESIPNFDSFSPLVPNIILIGYEHLETVFLERRVKLTKASLVLVLTKLLQLPWLLQKSFKKVGCKVVVAM
jgi:hypothetical protein